MKKYLFIVLLVGVCFSQKSYNEKHLVEQNGVWYKKFSDEVVNGNVFKEIDGIEAPLGKIKDGKKDGKWMVWYDNGTKNEERHYKNGLVHGTWKEYDTDGKLWSLKEFIDGDKNYFFTRFDKNGNERSKGEFKDGLPFNGKFSTHFKDESEKPFSTYRLTHFTYDQFECVERIQFDTNGDTAKIEKLVDGKMKFFPTISQKIYLDSLQAMKKEKQKFLESIEAIEKTLCYEEGLFKVFYRQYNTKGGSNVVDFELENSYNVNYNSIWFMVTAIKKDSNEKFSKRITFYDVDKNSTARESLFPYNNAVLKDIKLELTRQKRK